MVAQVQIPVRKWLSFVGAIVCCVAPLIALGAALTFLRDAHALLYDQKAYEAYRAYWGGNPAEVYSHWLDLLLMSGNALMLAWLVGVEAFFRRKGELSPGLRPLLSVSALLGVGLTGLVTISFDRFHGEGTVMPAYLLFFVPLLASSYYLLRRAVAWAGWKFGSVLILCASYGTLHAVAQLFYEPSGTGAPNILILPLLLGSVALAGTTAFRQRAPTGR